MSDRAVIVMLSERSLSGRSSRSTPAFRIASPAVYTAWSFRVQAERPGRHLGRASPEKVQVLAQHLSAGAGVCGVREGGDGIGHRDPIVGFDPSRDQFVEKMESRWLMRGPVWLDPRTERLIAPIGELRSDTSW